MTRTPREGKPRPVSVPGPQMLLYADGVQVNVAQHEQLGELSAIAFSAGPLSVEVRLPLSGLAQLIELAMQAHEHVAQQQTGIVLPGPGSDPSKLAEQQAKLKGDGNA